MNIAWFQKISLIEYPGKISAVIFTAGCNFRCSFCYVPQLVLPERIKKLKYINENIIFDYLKKSNNLIDAVVVTGGEPTLQNDLPLFLMGIKKMGYLTGIYTNGTNPEAIEILMNKKLVDYIAMDIKTSLELNKYKNIVGVNLNNIDLNKIKKSIDLIINSDLVYEFRTTIAKENHSIEDLISICKFIKGAKNYYLQNIYKADNISSKKLTPFSEDEINMVISRCSQYVNIKYRNNK